MNFTYIPSYNKQIVNSLFVKYWNRYLTYISRQFVEEGLQGSSSCYTVIEQYWLAFMFVIGIKKRLFYGETLEEIEDDFDMDNIRYKLSCNNINLYEIYTIFDITY